MWFAHVIYLWIIYIYIQENAAYCFHYLVALDALKGENGYGYVIFIYGLCIILHVRLKNHWKEMVSIFSDNNLQRTLHFHGGFSETDKMFASQMIKLNYFPTSPNVL